MFYEHILLIITSCKSRKLCNEISAYDTLEKSAGFLNTDFNQSSFWLINSLTITVYFIFQTCKYIAIDLEKSCVELV